MSSELWKIIVRGWLLLPLVSLFNYRERTSCLFLERLTNVVGSGFRRAVRSFSSSELSCFGPLDGSIGDSLS